MKFINLLKKELTELINMQLILGIAVAFGMFAAMGMIMKTAVNEINDETEHVVINICDKDDTEFTRSIIESMKKTDKSADGKSTIEVNVIDNVGDDYAAVIKDNDISDFVIIPKGFTDSLKKNEQPDLEVVKKMTGAAALSDINAGNENAISFIQQCIAGAIAQDLGMTEAQYKLMEQPVIIEDYTVVADKTAKISSAKITAKINMRNVMLPLIVFALLIFSSQSIITSISNEKIDKTLETLLSAPVSRLSVISAKMLAAAIVALVNAAAYMAGYSIFMNNITENVSDAIAESGLNITVDQAMEQLGLNIGFSDYLLVGVQLFLSIMICLSVSIMLGALVNDSKSVSNMIMPIMMLAMVPFLVSSLIDINSLPTAARMLIYAIPFTHTFIAVPNLSFGNNSLFIGGIIYQLVFCMICIFAALRLFMSDKILTISLNFGQKSKYKRKKKKGAPDYDDE